MLFTRCAQLFQNRRSHLNVLGTRKVTCWGRKNPVRHPLAPRIYVALLYISQMLPKFNIVRAPSFIFLRTGISEWPSSRSVLRQAQKFCFTLQSIMGISPITWLQTQAIKGLSFHTNGRANSLDEAEKDQSRELFYVRQQSDAEKNRKHLQIQINRSFFFKSQSTIEKAARISNEKHAGYTALVAVPLTCG